MATDNYSLALTHQKYLYNLSNKLKISSELLFLYNLKQKI